MNGSAICILVIDEDDGSILVAPFKNAGFIVSHETVSTTAALEDALRTPKWDAVLDANNTPELPPPAALAIVRARFPDIPFLVISDTVTDAEAGALIAAGVSDVLPRRSPARLVPRVERAMRAASIRRLYAAMQTAFAESEARLDTIAWNIPGMIYQLVLATDGSLRLPYVSEGSYALLGVRPETLREQPSALLGLIFAEDLESFGATMRESAARLSDWNWEGRVQVGDQHETKWVNLRASARAAEGGAVQWEGMMWNITNSKRAELDLLESRRELQALSAHLETIKEQERANIAREIHDDIGGTLTAVKIDLVWLAGRMKDAPKALREKLRTLEELVDQAMTTSTRIARALRPTVLDFGIVAAIEWQTEEFRRRLGIETRLTCPESDIELEPETALALFRIFQESLTNIAKHAKASRVDIMLERRDDDIVLHVADDGRGLVPDDLGKPRSFGIRGMLERARALGGEAEVSAGREGGTSVTARLPARAPAADVSELPEDVH